MRKYEIGLLYELQKKLREREQEKFEIIKKNEKCQRDLNNTIESLDFSIENLKKAIEELK